VSRGRLGRLYATDEPNTSAEASDTARERREGSCGTPANQATGLGVGSSPSPGRPLLPVTLLSGFAGSGKTSVLKHLLRQAAGRRVAVIVNDNIVADPAELDAAVAMPRVHAAQAPEQWISMRQGCICCSLREDLLSAVRQLATQGTYDYLLIESTGVTAPLPVAEMFTFADERGESLADVARLDTLVTLVDAEHFLDDWQSEDELSTRQLALDEDDQRSVSDLLVEQIEFANVLVLSKLDRVSAEDAERIEALLHQLNPEARIARATHGNLPAEAVLDTGLFAFEELEQAAGWIAALRGEPAAPDEQHGLGTFVYRARIPFHPQRLWDLLGDAATWEGVLRSKGFFWLASRMQISGLWSHAGGSAQCDGTGPWYAALPEAEWPEDEDDRQLILDDFVEPWGDRRQELVFIGAELDEARLRGKLDAALLNAQELAQGPSEWAKWDDPFPDWIGHEPPPLARP
jgi:G3E family GTPase